MPSRLSLILAELGLGPLQLPDSHPHIGYPDLIHFGVDPVLTADVRFSLFTLIQCIIHCIM